jgi:hypothetical protein
MTYEDFQNFAVLFDDCGFEVYEGSERYFLERFVKAEDDEAASQLRDTLEAREAMEHLRSKWFSLLDESSHLETQKREAIRVRFLQGLNKAIGPLLRLTPLEILSDPRFDRAPESLQASDYHTNNKEPDGSLFLYTITTNPFESFDRLVDYKDEDSNPDVSGAESDDNNEGDGLFLGEMDAVIFEEEW